MNVRYVCVSAIRYKYSSGKEALRTFPAHREFFGNILLQVFVSSPDISRGPVLAVLYVHSTWNINSERT